MSPHPAEPTCGGSGSTRPGPDADTWPDLPAAQQPTWPDAEEAAAVVAELRSRPPLVFAEEVDRLRGRLASVARGEAFILQGGECAETFQQATADSIRDRIGILLQMAAVLTYGSGTPVVKIGRLAGQFAKPRSRDTETRGELTLPAYRGDMVNGFAFTAESRRHDPQRMLQAYHCAAATMNLVRAYTTGGFADLGRVDEWMLGAGDSPARGRFAELSQGIGRALRFARACGVDSPAWHGVDFYASHEALVLDYQRALVHRDPRTGLLYDTSGHFLWAGERTRDPDGAHIDLLARIANPVGVKLGPTSRLDDVLRLADRLDPQREPGRLTFIARMGAGEVRDRLAPLVEGVRSAGLAPIWVCDPMHGNTFESTTGYKTRRFDDIVEEVRGFFEVHEAVGTVPGGIHVELTGADVTECLGGVGEIEVADLERRYETVCDPRLNDQQSLELAFLVAQMLERRA